MEFAGFFRYSGSIVAITRVDDGVFVDVNPEFERVLGYARHEVVGKRPVDIALWPDHEIRALIWSRLRTQYHLASESITCRTRDGNLLRGRLNCEMFDHDGLPHVLSIVQDLVAVDAATVDPHPDVESYRALFHAAAEGIYRSLPNGGFIDVNPAMARILGYDSASHLLTQLREQSSTLYVDQVHGRWLRAELEARGRIDQVRSQVYRRDRSIIWISENARTVVGHDGVVLFYEGTMVDITERLAADAALRQSEALYKVLVDNCRDGVFLIQRGRVLFANRALAQMLGYKQAELVGVEYMSLIAPEDLAAQALRRAARESGSRTTQSYEVQMVRRDGTRMLVLVLADAVEYNGDIASSGLIRDVTEDRRQQRALEDAERKYRELFANSVTGLFQTSPDGRILEANLAMAAMLGYESPHDLIDSVPHMLQIYVDPADRERLLERLTVEGRVDRMICPVRRKDGGSIWAEINARTIIDAATGAIHFEGSVQDITARQLAERAVQRSEAKYRTLVEHSQVGVFIMLGDVYVYANQAYAAILDYPEEDLVGKSFREVVAPESLPAAEERFHLRQAGMPVSTDFEVCMLRRDGARVYVTVSSGPVVLDGVAHTTGTVRDITRHRQAEQRLKFHATHDPLTGLPNRLLFQQRLQETIDRARTKGVADFAVLFLDLDGFKLVNDSLGHAAGDRLLVVIAEKLGEAMSGQALIARYGGDEFTILPHGACDRERVQHLARSVLKLFEESVDIGGHRVFSGASVGIVLGRPEYRSPDQVLRDADTAMYRAKAGGKSGFVIFDEAMHRAARARFQLETDLRLALERGEFCVYYQPIVALGSGAIVGCEGLVRWRHPERGLLLPGDFLAVAEETGLIVSLDWWVLEQVCRQLIDWHSRYPAFSDLRANVNVDERQLADAQMATVMRRILERTGVDPAHIALEVTETVFRGGRGQAASTLGALKAVGVSLVVDDFGTGYSSLDSFAASPFDALKVDRSFVQDMEFNRRHRAIVRTITGFAEDLGLQLTAEGVETEGQARLLAEMGCVTAQGYLYSKPVPAESFEALLGSRRVLVRA